MVMVPDSTDTETYCRCLPPKGPQLKDQLLGKLWLLP